MFQFQFGVTGPGNLKTPGFHLTKIAHKHSATLEPTVLLLIWFSHEQDLAKILQQDVQGNYLQLSVQRADTCRSCVDHVGHAGHAGRASGVRFGRLCYSGTWGAARPRWSERVWTCCWQVTMGHPRWIKIDKDWWLKHIETYRNMR